MTALEFVKAYRRALITEGSIAWHMAANLGLEMEHVPGTKCHRLTHLQIRKFIRKHRGGRRYEIRKGRSCKTAG